MNSAGSNIRQDNILRFAIKSITDLICAIFGICLQPLRKLNLLEIGFCSNRADRTIFQLQELLVPNCSRMLAQINYRIRS